MPLVSNDLQYLETRFKELKAKYVLRASQQALPMSDGVAFGRSDQFLTSLHKELRDTAAQIIGLKYDPLQVIERMEQKQ